MHDASLRRRQSLILYARHNFAETVFMDIDGKSMIYPFKICSPKSLLLQHAKLLIFYIKSLF